MAARVGPALVISTGNLGWTRSAPTIEIAEISRVAVSRTVIKKRKIYYYQDIRVLPDEVMPALLVMLRYIQLEVIRDLCAWKAVNV